MKAINYTSILVLCASLSIYSSLFCTSRVAVFCSADDKVAKCFKDEAVFLGAEIAKNGLGLVTGGSKTGLMKEVVDGYDSFGSQAKSIYGILPQALAQYDIHHPLIPAENLIWVDTIHVRLAQFHDKAESIVVLPGGFGTLHELLDFLVHKQFGLIDKKIVLINLNGFWNNLLLQFKDMIANNLLAEKTVEGLCVVSTVKECIQELVAQSEKKSGRGLEDKYWER